MIIGMATQFMPALDQFPAAFLCDQVPFGFFRTNQVACNIESAMNPMLVENGSPGAFSRIRHIVKCESDDPFILRQAEWAQWKPTADAVVQPYSIPFQTAARLVETIHFHHCPSPQKLFQTSFAFACKRNPKTATIMQNHTAPPF